ncbi:MAG: hypothetical protein K0R30_2574 [Ornithinibacter sp.]|nr:hypothetical protein [Ornithinibacter sp.]
MTRVLTALTHHHEPEFVRLLESALDIELVRRCADVAELLSVGAAGVARVAVVSPDLRGLDRDALRQLAGHGVRVAGLVGPDDDEGERRLRQLGVATILGPKGDPHEVAAALTSLAGATTSVGASLSSTGSLVNGREGGVGATPAAPGWAGIQLDDGEHGDGRSQLTVVWGPTGAPGRTTVAVTLAAHLAAAGMATMLVDLDTWGASVAQVLGLVDEAPGVAAAARASEQGTLDVPGLARLSPEVVPGLRVLTGLPKNASTLTALESADHLVVVGAADPVGLQRLVRAVQDVAVLPSPRPTVVVNKVRSSVAGPRPERAIRDVLGRFAGMDDVRFMPWAPDDCDAAVLAGRSLVEVAPESPLTLAVADLAARLDDRMPSRPRARGFRRTRRAV